MKTITIESEHEFTFDFYSLVLVTRVGLVNLPSGYLEKERAIEMGAYYCSKGWVDTAGQSWVVYTYSIIKNVMFV